MRRTQRSRQLQLALCTPVGRCQQIRYEITSALKLIFDLCPSQINPLVCGGQEIVGECHATDRDQTNNETSALKPMESLTGLQALETSQLLSGLDLAEGGVDEFGWDVHLTPRLREFLTGVHRVPFSLETGRQLEHL